MNGSFVFLILMAGMAAGQVPGYTPPPPPPPPGAQPGPEPGPGPMMPGNSLDQLVSRIALYPDPLLAQVLPASTYYDQISQAAAWSNQHANLTGNALASAIQEDNLQWDPSVLALLPFPTVLNMMAQDPGWTQQLGNAVLAQRADVMDAVQRMRQQSYNYGYLRTSPYNTVVNSGGYIQIAPVNPAYLYVPMYDPRVVYFAPRAGFAIGAAIRFGPAVVIGASFAPWGWTRPYFDWGGHGIFFDRTPWNRGWGNRRYYAHPYERRFVGRPGGRIERHGGRR